MNGALTDSRLQAVQRRTGVGENVYMALTLPSEMLMIVTLARVF